MSLPLGALTEISRRQLLGTGAAALAATGTAPVFATTSAAAGATGPLFGRAKSVIFLWLSGGPPQHETFDPKPGAPAEIRGPFQPISTNIPGIHFSELLPRCARMADKLAVVRSLYTNNNIHGGSGYWVLTGRQLVTSDGENSRPNDWPFMGSIVKLLRPSTKLPSLTSVTLPEIFLGNGGNLHAGQFGGFIGAQWNPELITCNPADPKSQLAGDYAIQVSPAQFQQRLKLLEQLGSEGSGGSRSSASSAYHRLQQQALDLLRSNGAGRAFSLAEEKPETRSRYGMHHWGQSVLLARRLVEAGVRFVTVNWPRVPGDRGVDNPLWDTHARNFDRMEDALAPQFDIGFTALIEDLAERGLLDDTLVVAVGEFGRTPRVNRNAGRDHWGGVFSAVLAGGGISGGQVFGSSDKQGAYPATDAVNAGHLPATIFHLLGIDPQGTFHDREGRELSISDVEPLYKLLGEAPATHERTVATGDPAQVPAYSATPLLNADFSPYAIVRPLDAPANPKGWRAGPLSESAELPAFGVRLTSAPNASGGRAARLGIFSGMAATPRAFEAAGTVTLAQQIRDPQSGRFTVTVAVRGEGSSRAFYDDVFLKNFRCRLMIFQFTNVSKNPLERHELASLDFRPRFGGTSATTMETFSVEKLLGNTKLGANFSFGLGVGIAVVVERIGSGPLPLPAGAEAYVSVERADVAFAGLHV